MVSWLGQYIPERVFMEVTSMRDLLKILVTSRAPLGFGKVDVKVCDRYSVHAVIMSKRISVFLLRKTIPSSVLV